MSDEHNEPHLELVLDERSLKFQCGQTIKGTLTVDVPQPRSCLGIEVRLWWAAYGSQRATDVITVEAERTLHGGGRLEEKTAFNFELEIPTRFTSHRGSLVEVCWNVTGRVRWTKNLKSTTKRIIQVVPAPLPPDPEEAAGAALNDPYRGVGAAPERRTPLWKMDDIEQLRRRLGENQEVLKNIQGLRRRSALYRLWTTVKVSISTLLMVLLWAVTMAFGASLLVFGVQLVVTGEDFTIGLCYLALGSGVILPTVWGIKWIRRKVERRLKGKMVIDIIGGPMVVACGECPEFTFRIRRSKDRPVEAINWQIRYIERSMRKVKKRNKDSEYTVTEWDSKESFTDWGELEPPQMNAGVNESEALSFAGEVAELGPSTVLTSSRDIQWEATVKLMSLDDTYTDSFPFIVVPFSSERDPNRSPQGPDTK